MPGRQWYLLRERKFDEDAVQDLAALKAALGMSDSEARTVPALYIPLHTQSSALEHDCDCQVTGKAGPGRHILTVHACNHVGSDVIHR